MGKDLHSNIIRNFEEASDNYNQSAVIQKIFAHKLAKQCLHQNINPGIWLDLGSGTGLLADILEDLHPSQLVIRVDGAKEMLEQHSPQKQLKLWDLELGLPTNLSRSPNLIASNFALHWLTEPRVKIQQWFSALAPGGWLAIALPVKGCFPEWHAAAKSAKVICTAMNFPSSISLANAIPTENIRFNELERYTQTEVEIASLLKPIIKVGAHTTPKKSLKISHWRRLYNNWPKSTHSNKPQLTWLVQILLAQK
ncbi:MULTISPECIES: methyltransferase domain-containing protein [Prochlorococcus]|uniref:methyltransferase domain-containing protein n=1 Tax=Prochlorococcus TaxID=1218 RepID=UPI000533B49F|nr:MULTISPECIES: methyltransferase domain-containing protein [Prochlorococcus]KGG13499.1 Biotin synthesis protein bioC [Prochlorococcus sp. MIT 0601]